MNSRPAELVAWLENISGPDWLWYAKFIPANDTYAKPNVHQGGPYLSKELLRRAFPGLVVQVQKVENPDLIIPVSFDSHPAKLDIRLVWYNSKQFKNQKNGRDEARMTQWGGKSSPLLAPEATGSLVVFAFKVREELDADECRVWLCDSAEEVDHVLGVLGDVEPGQGVLFSPTGRFHDPSITATGCHLGIESIPPEWLETFPTGADIVGWVVEERQQYRGLRPDDRLLKRRTCEYEVFLSVEREHVLPRLAKGFSAVDEFVDFANAVTNRRKSRSGRSLELHLRRIFDEEGVRYSPQPQTEGTRTPDFLFPGVAEYRNEGWPRQRLRMLAAKTTCKDRWRQILNEAQRVQPVKHLFTLQEGVSSEQYREMREEGVALVVPSSNVSAFPDDVQAELATLESFIGDVKSLAE
jgi:hypothetical protein